MRWKQTTSIFLSDVLLFAFAFAELALMLIPILLSRDHSCGLWYEDNMVILGIEIGFCVAVMGWAIFRISHKIKVERRIQ